MDKLMNAASAVVTVRKEVKFTLPNQHTGQRKAGDIIGLLEPIGFGGCETELLSERHEFVWSGDIAKNLVEFVKKNVSVLFDKFSVIDFTEYYTVNDGEHYTRVIIELDDKHTKPYEVGNYTDTVGETFTSEDHDILTINPDKYAFIERKKTAKNKFDWGCLDKEIEVCIIRWKDKPYACMTVIPKEVNILSDETYRDVTIKRNVIFKNDGMSVFKVAGKVAINAVTPIECSGGIVNIKGEPNSELLLICADQQPCIGSRTRTGMSYGRWSPEGSAPKEIIIDGCKVICVNKVPGFSIGAYGDNVIPEVKCINGGTLICPEMTGERIILRNAQAPGGSTKISESMVYTIKKAGDNMLDLMDPKVRDAYYDLIIKYPQCTDVIISTTTLVDIQEAMSLLKLNSKVDVTLLMTSDAKMYKKRGALLLRLPEMDKAAKCEEFIFEMKKEEFIKDFIYKGNNILQPNAAVNLIHLFKKIAIKDLCWDFMKEVCYEIIPAYYYDFQEHRGKTNEEYVDRFLEENSKLIDEKYQEMIDPQSIYYFLWDNSVINWDKKK